MKVGTTRSCSLTWRTWRTSNFYRELLAYRQQPTPGERKRLERRFDALFATKTGYWALDERIGDPAKKTSLLMVLVHPEIPLHNNC